MFENVYDLLYNNINTVKIPNLTNKNGKLDRCRSYTILECFVNDWCKKNSNKYEIRDIIIYLIKRSGKFLPECIEFLEEKHFLSFKK